MHFLVNYCCIHFSLSRMVIWFSYFAFRLFIHCNCSVYFMAFLDNKIIYYIYHLLNFHRWSLTSSNYFVKLSHFYAIISCLNVSLSSVSSWYLSYLISRFWCHLFLLKVYLSLCVILSSYFAPSLIVMNSLLGRV